MVAFRAAIWRFKEENRGLMRRLFGDMDSSSVYREMRATSFVSSFKTTPSTYKKQKNKRSGPMLVPRVAGASILAAADPTKGFPALQSQYNIRVGSGLSKDTDHAVINMMIVQTTRLFMFIFFCFHRGVPVNRKARCFHESRSASLKRRKWWLRVGEPM